MTIVRETSVDTRPWERISELFAEARLLDGVRQIEFLKEKCDQDQDLFEQVKSLLEIDGKTRLRDSGSTVSALCIPQVIGGRFRIIRFVADGGMGTVYEAEDLQLKDRIALKTIRPEITSDPKNVERFKREILLGKKVTHPNVCRIHDLGVHVSETGTEFLFLTMQFLRGETLASRIRRGPIPEQEAVPLIEDMVDALSAAHKAEVIHRDFKSGNVMLVPASDRTRAVVTDFGLALSTHDSKSLTHAGVVGTVDYMAPEQIKGEEITPATDVYALGVVMYEMVTGQRPFVAESKVTVALKHLNDEPQPPRNLSPHLKPSWDEAILGCLRKNPQDRFQSADVVTTLVRNGTKSQARVRRSPSVRRLSTRLVVLSVAFSLVLLLGAVPAIQRTVKEWLHIVPMPRSGQLAVLPFMVSPDDPEAATLEYGLADTLTSRLTRLSGSGTLQIVPASEIRAKSITTLEQARQEFGVNLGLEISLRRSGDMVRINYGLVDARTHHEMKGDTITAPLSDGFALEDRVADSVVTALQLDLQPEERRQLTAHGTNEPAAYDYYLEGRGYLQEYQKVENVDSAISVFQHAVQRDPHYAMAFSGLGQAYWRKYEINNDNQWAEQARTECEHSLSLDENQADGHNCLGLVYNGTGKYEEAARQYQLAVDLEPANDDAIRGLGSAYRSLGRMSEAEKTYQRAIAARPSYWLGYNALGGLYMAVGRYKEAAGMFTRVTTLAPDSYRGYSNLGGAYVLLGRYGDAVDMFRRSIEIRPTYEAYSNLATAYFRLRQFRSAADSYHAALTINDQDSVVWGNLADAYYYGGKRRESQEPYEKAISLAKARLEINPRDASLLGDLAAYESMVGKREEAISSLAKALEQSGYNDPDVLFEAVIVHNQFGETKEAIDWLSKALAAGYSPEIVLNAPALESLHSDLRFQSLMKTTTSNRN